MRAFLFIIWVKSSKVVSNMLSTIEALATSHYEIVEQNGRQVVSASVVLDEKLSGNSLLKLGFSFHIQVILQSQIFTTTIH